MIGEPERTQQVRPAQLIRELPEDERPRERLLAHGGQGLSDSELVAGPFTEYSGMRFGFFFFAEYGALFIMSGILISLFFGGYLAPWPFPAQLGGFAGTLWGIFWFFLKTYIFVFIAVWLRATLPRVRVDQLMSVAWKVLLPLALVNLFVTAIAVVVFDL